ncbi:hypothetical protein AAFF_G00018840 [Aldrovandia affinis]|uniref:Uncharacterized protein n=1 Tax=Aldrovandia affinis TaxID=143900 RepID=A0AAD7S5W0_9TELE|nr:hypothetical protein AAFF_G00018840 [Aldrovandia affinis]
MLRARQPSPAQCQAVSRHQWRAGLTLAPRGSPRHPCPAHLPHEQSSPGVGGSVQHRSEEGELGVNHVTFCHIAIASRSRSVYDVSVSYRYGSNGGHSSSLATVHERRSEVALRRGVRAPAWPSLTPSMKQGLSSSAADLGAEGAEAEEEGSRQNPDQDSVKQQQQLSPERQNECQCGSSPSWPRAVTHEHTGQAIPPHSSYAPPLRYDALYSPVQFLFPTTDLKIHP